MQAVRKSTIMLCLLLSDLTAVYAQQYSIVEVTTRAQRIHQSTFVFDGHVCHTHCEECLFVFYENGYC